MGGTVFPSVRLVIASVLVLDPSIVISLRLGVVTHRYNSRQKSPRSIVHQHRSSITTAFRPRHHKLPRSNRLIKFEYRSSINNVWVHGITPDAVIPKEEPSVNFLIFYSSVGAPITGSVHSFIYSNRLTKTVGACLPFGNSFIYDATRKSVLGTWVDTWTHAGTRGSITQSGNCNSITGEPQQSYKWEC